MAPLSTPGRWGGRLARVADCRLPTASAARPSPTCVGTSTRTSGCRAWGPTGPEGPDGREGKDLGDEGGGRRRGRSSPSPRSTRPACPRRTARPGARSRTGAPPAAPRRRPGGPSAVPCGGLVRRTPRPRQAAPAARRVRCFVGGRGRPGLEHLRSSRPRAGPARALRDSQQARPVRIAPQTELPPPGAFEMPSHALASLSVIFPFCPRRTVVRCHRIQAFDSEPSRFGFLASEPGRTDELPSGDPSSPRPSVRNSACP